MTGPVLQVDGLAKSYAGFIAVAGVSLAVDRGEIVALIGPNGAGKTTTFNMINGQIRPDAGTVRLDGRDVTGQPARALWRAGVGRTFQISATFASMTVAENIAVALISLEDRIGGLGPALPAHRDAALHLLAEVGMRSAADRPCSTLAYGDIKRVELAMALANRPRLLLMDEPTAGMAPRERGSLMREMARLVRSQQIAVLFTEHDMDVVFAHADRILVMSRGALIAAGSPEQVRNDPTVRDVYLGAGVPVSRP